MPKRKEGLHHDSCTLSDDLIQCHEQTYANHLPVALTVDIEDTTQWLPSAIEYDVDSKPVPKRSARLRPLVCCMSLFVVCCTIAVMLAVIANRSGCKSRCSVREFIGIQEYVTSFVGEALIAGDSSQSARAKALHWIIHEDPQQLDLRSGGRLLQRFSLAAAYHASQREGETRPYGKDNTILWLSGESECEWSGVVCDSLGNVRSIDLFDHGKTAWIREISPELLNLPFLQKLSMPFGRLETTDALFGRNQMELKHLSTLNLRRNNLRTSDEVIEGNNTLAFSELRSLKHVDLGENKLGGTLNATSLFQTPQDVKVLLLDDNMFSGFLPIQGHGNFHNLRRLNVSQNQFEGDIFRSFDELPYVDEVTLHDNLFTGSLPELDPDSPLLYFEAGNNRFGGSIPESLVASSRLAHLGLELNELDGTLPAITASQLRHLDVHGNQLSGSLEDLYLNDGLGSLFYFDISQNSLGGSMKSICDGRFPATLISDCLETTTNCTCCTRCCQSSTGYCMDMI